MPKVKFIAPRADMGTHFAEVAMVPFPLSEIPRVHDFVRVSGLIKTIDGQAQMTGRHELAGVVYRVTHNIKDKGMSQVSGGGGVWESNVDHDITVWLGRS